MADPWRVRGLAEKDWSDSLSARPAVSPASAADPSARYTAVQFARAIGVSAARVRQRLSGAAAGGWTLAQVPQDWLETITRNRLRAGYLTDDEWLTSRPVLALHRPAEQLPPDCRREVTRRRDILSPILSRNAGKPVSELLRLAKPAFRPAQPSDSTLRRYIEEAIERDNGRCNFQRLELYMPRRVRRPHPMPRTVPTITSWRDACFILQNEIAAGAGEVSAIRAMRERIAASVLGEDLTANAIRKSLKRRFGQWKSEGDLKDGRRGQSGRKTKFELSADETYALRALNLKKDSLSLAIELFASHRACSPGTRALILSEMDRASDLGIDPSWPMSLRRAGEVSGEERALFRGDKAFQKYAICDQRGMFFVDEVGEKRQLLPNTIWESDDMSLNEPFSFVNPDNGAIEIGRQVLATIDVYSANWLGVSPIGRTRDAYRIEDIADHALGCVVQNGLPMMWRLERGIWENQFFNGVPLRDGQLWGGIDSIIRIERVFTPRGKGLIESSFNFLQRLLAHESTSIGRKRGEFQAATKLMSAAQRGNAAAAAAFWDISAAADGLEQAMLAANLRPKQRESFGSKKVVPADLYRTAVRRDCSNEELWRFCPVKREATVRRGFLTMPVPHYPLPFRFRVNGISDLYLEEGYRVLVAFHPGHPERGCHVFNGDDTARNRSAIPIGERLLMAEMAEDSPQVNFSPDDLTYRARKNANAAVRSEFRAIVRAGQTANRVSTARDGFGQTATRMTGPMSEAAERGAIGARMPDETDARGRKLQAESKELEALDEQIDKASGDLDELDYYNNGGRATMNSDRCWFRDLSNEERDSAREKLVARISDLRRAWKALLSTRTAAAQTASR